MNKKALASIFSVFLLAAGCSNNDEEPQKEDVKQETTKETTKEATAEAQQETTKETATETTKETTTAKQQEQKEGSEEMKLNEELTKKAKEEEGVTRAQVFEKDDKVLGRFIVDEKVSDKETKELVEKYAKELEAEYKNKEVNVQAIKDGKVIEEKTAGAKKPEEAKKTNPDAKTAEELNATVLNTVPGVFVAKIPLKDAKSVDATEKSTLTLKVDGKAAVTLKYNTEHKVFLNANIQGDYSVDELLNSPVSVNNK